MLLQMVLFHSFFMTEKSWFHIFKAIWSQIISSTLLFSPLWQRRLSTMNKACQSHFLLVSALLFLLEALHVMHIKYFHLIFSSLQFSSVAQSCPTLFDPMNCSMPGLPVHHQLPEFTQAHVHRVRDAIQPSHPLLSPSPPALNPSQHQSLFQWVNSLHEMAKVLEFQL